MQNLDIFLVYLLVRAGQKLAWFIEGDVVFFFVSVLVGVISRDVVMMNIYENI